VNEDVGLLVEIEISCGLKADESHNETKPQLPKEAIRESLKGIESLIAQKDRRIRRS
jgi:hypothetical protein